MNPIPGLDLQIPDWLPWFLWGGLALVVVGVPLRVLWTATRRGRDRSERSAKFVDRLRERFGEVALRRGVVGPDRVVFSHDGREGAVWIDGDHGLTIEAGGNVGFPVPFIVKTKGRWTGGTAFLGLRPLPRIEIHDAMIDDAVAIYTTPTFGGWLRERILEDLDARPEPAKGEIARQSTVAESLVVLRRAPGVRSFRLTGRPGGRLRLRLRLHSEDLLYRPDEMESLVHHLVNLYDRLVMD